MKKTIILLIFLFPLIGYCDTLDYWSVYLNDSLIGHFNSETVDNEIKINYNSILDSDTISIIYGNDHQCSNCEYYYALKDLQTGYKIHIERRNEVQKKVSFPLNMIKKFKSKRLFEIFVYQNSYKDNNDNYTQLIRFQLE